MSSEYWFFFEFYAKGQLVGRSRVFKVTNSGDHADARREAEEQWLAAGGLRDNAFARVPGAPPDKPTVVTLREHAESPSRRN